ncbi:MAG TPA: glycosyltransferase family 2 protein [Pseudolysinimonas sp.]|jgi:cellulose synthase/poly-beta-1,6-N-acetylglucosamine synthase-like glycosyltransferase
MLTVALIALLVVGVNTILWTAAAAVRTVGERIRRPVPAPPGRLGPSDVAVLVAAHNEELGIATTVRSAAAAVPVDNVFVVSDGSSDETAQLASEVGATVLDLRPNRGKAGALAALIEEFDLAGRFEVVLLLDADTQLSPDYLSTGLPMFDDPNVVAVAGHAMTLTSPAPATATGRLLIAYRDRVYVAVQYLQKFGQASRWINAVSIVPGFASMYRTRILDRVDIDAPGLTIEDYNMTFEVHAKRLGRIAFHPGAAIALTQDPDSLHDYVRQVRRWNLGFWQTVRRHGVHLGRFWAILTLFILELVSSSAFVLALLPLLLLSIVATSMVAIGVDHNGVVAAIADILPPWVIVVGALLPDYVLTVFTAVVTRRPRYLLIGVFFPLLRMLDAALCLRALVDAFGRGGDGRWHSPARRAVDVATRE